MRGERASRRPVELREVDARRGVLLVGGGAATQVDGLLMFPWLWVYAPQISWPLSGAVTQDLTPDAFFRGIKPGAGVPAIEERSSSRPPTASNSAG
jgi:hypothetical protein